MLLVDGHNICALQSSPISPALHQISQIACLKHLNVGHENLLDEMDHLTICVMGNCAISTYLSLAAYTQHSQNPRFQKKNIQDYKLNKKKSNDDD